MTALALVLAPAVATASQPDGPFTIAYRSDDLPRVAAHQSAPGSSASPAQEHTRVRVALSEAANKRLKARRLRRLLAIELDDIATIDPHPLGPLGRDLIRVWLELPTERRALIEVRGGGRSLARRTLVIAEFEGDVAARVVAIAVAQMVRVQWRAELRARSAPKTAGGDGGPARDPESAFTLGGSLTGLWLPGSAPAALLGPELSLSHHGDLTGHTLYGRWLMGADGERHGRWFELGAAIDMTLALSQSWRARLGARAGGVVLALPEADPIDSAVASPTDWTVRGGAQLGIEASPEPKTWIGLSLEPGATLRSLNVVDRSGHHTNLGGFALGLSLSVLSAPWLEPAASATTTTGRASQQGLSH